MEIKVINKSFIINNVPLEKIEFEKNILKVSLDDANEKRYEIIFKPFQALKITTSDCFDNSILLISENLERGRYSRHILEVINSDWIESLKNVLKDNDESANFLDKARHFILDLGDNIVEIIAWNIEFIK